MKYCRIKSCPNFFGFDIGSVFQLPKYDLKLREEWLNALAAHDVRFREIAKYLQPMICHLHFDPDDIKRNGNGQMRLERNAIPKYFHSKNIIEKQSIPVVDPFEKPFKCGKCNQSFKDPRQLGKHISNHDEYVIKSGNQQTREHLVKRDKKEMKEQKKMTGTIPAPFECYICKEPFKTKRKLMQHFKEQHKLKEFKHESKCPICMVKTTGQQISEHLCRSEDKIVQCEYCLETFKSVVTLLDHIEEIHEDNKFYKCLKCEQIFHAKILLEYHDQGHLLSNIQEKIHVCHFCKVKFTQEDRLRKHIDNIHNEAKKDYLCDECGKAFFSEAHLRIHKKIHEEPKYQCPECPKRCAARSTLIKHQKIHSNKKWVCTICSKELSTSYQLKKHSRIHSRTEADRIHPCSECSLKFYTQKDAKKHLSVVHTSIRQFQCGYCDSSYKHRGDLNKHLRTHLGDDMYKCPDCPKRFRIPYDLQKHSYEHYKKQPMETD